MNSTIEKIAAAVREYHGGAESGHGWWHVDRVRHTAMAIQRDEARGNPLVVEVAALVHDIGDYKVKGMDDDTGAVEKILKESELPGEVIRETLYIHENISFRKSLEGAVARTPELDIVQDADRLDAIGAIGIARAFSYGGSKGNEIYIPGEKPVNIDSGEAYRNSQSCVINHFYEKLLTLKDKMNTSTGARIAAGRHRFMELFLEQFFKEMGKGTSDDNK
ncbi:MAG: HD domain-containing protein [Bacteroidales bacterium]|nr:HD domain-containing protein [Bacteroidales bacterium]